MSNYFTHLGLNSDEQAIFELLLKYGSQSASQVANKAGKPRATVYGILADLVKRGFVQESEKGSIKTFQASPFNVIKHSTEAKIDSLKDALIFLEKDIEGAPKKNKKTKFTFFSGAEGVRQILIDMLTYKNVETSAFWPIKDMLSILSPEFFRYLNKERIKSNIYTRAIWPEKQIIDVVKHPYLGSGEEFLREIRVAPKEINFSMGYWIYADKVAFVSSKKEAFGFIIQSEEFVDMLQKQFELVWQLSRSLKQKENKETKEFLKGINKR